jgi:hypothetical protein
MSTGDAMKVTKLPCTTKPAALAWIRERGLTGFGILQLLHDDDCPAIQTQQDADCTAPCIPDIYLLEPFTASPAEQKAVLN